MNRYRITDLDIEGTPVLFTVGGEEVEGCLIITSRGRRIYRIYTDSPRRKHTRDLPSFAEPSLWRPLYPERWMEQLPAPAVIQQAMYDGTIRPEPSEQTEPVREVDDWPIPGLRIGLGRPNSRDEAEARIMRAIRTSDALERLDDDRRSTACWPPALLFKARQVEKALRSSRTGTLGSLHKSDYEQIHVDKSDLRALPDIWIPTRRDISDIEANVLLWLRGLTPNPSHVLHMRAARPQYSWRAISEYLHRSDYVVKRWYTNAIDHVWQKARP